MPRNVRPFWVEVTIDGQKSKLSGGPKSLEGGIEAVFKIREQGTVSERKLCVRGYRVGDGLILRAWCEGPGEAYEPITIETDL